MGHVNCANAPTRAVGQTLSQASMDRQVVSPLCFKLPQKTQASHHNVQGINEPMNYLTLRRLA
eukprot:scaffold488_cov372-Prasinococcus_capsulatus_cf.AAC.3